jgi:hypothetical protein
MSVIKSKIYGQTKMNLDKYSVISGKDHRSFEFYSEGPKGRIRKVIYYQLLSRWGDNVYNLAFGDWVENAKKVNDKVTTNNNDRQKILATVASTVWEFISYHPGSIVYAEGSTPSRTRLYQMGIAAYWHEISQQFEVLGFRMERWEPFQPGQNYEAFAIKIKL